MSPRIARSSSITDHNRVREPQLAPQARGPRLHRGTVVHSALSVPKRFGQAPSLPYTTPEMMLAAQMAGQPMFDIGAMTRAGTTLRAGNHGATSAQAIKFDAPTAKVTAQGLIDALRKVDVSGLLKAGIKPTAVFDFDNTLAAGDVFFSFADLVIARQAFPSANANRVANLLMQATDGHAQVGSSMSTNNIMALGSQMAQSGRLQVSSYFFMFLAALVGADTARLSSLAEHLFDKGAPGQKPYVTHLFGTAEAGSTAIIRTLADRGIEPHIITLGLPFVVRAASKHLGIPPNRIHGFDLEVVNGKFTGRAIDVRVLGKHVMCDAQVSRQPLFAFGDSLQSDSPMLQRATVRSFVVDPKPEFHEHIAEQHADLTLLTYKG